MKKIELKSKTSAIAIILMLTFSFMIVSLPVTNAHDPPWSIPTYAFLSVQPNPIGVNQTAFVVLWLDRVMPGAALGNDIRFHNFKLEITKPDGSTETMDFPIITDTTSSAYTLYKPEQAGDYIFEFTYPGEHYVWDQTTNPDLSDADAAYYGDTFLPSSRTVTLTVQTELLPEPVLSYPLPQEYWTRPIEGENTDWWTISSNWLGRQSPQLAEGRFRVEPDGVGPKTPHVMWTRPIQDGGVVGGSGVSEISGDMYYPGLTYNRRFNNPIIIHGRLYYTEPVDITDHYWISGGNPDAPVKCVDLRTGETIWSTTDMKPVPQFGYLYTLHGPNMHGTWPAILFSADFGRAYDARTGTPLFNVTNIPFTRSHTPTLSVGRDVLGPDGTIYLIELNTENNWLAQWNSSRLWSNQAIPRIPQEVDAGTPDRYDWNITIPSTLPDNMNIIMTFMDDIVLLSNIRTAFGFGPSAFGTIDPYTVAALSLKPESRGDLLWSYEDSAEGRTRAMPGKLVDPINRVFMTYDRETLDIEGFSLDNGTHLWTASVPETTSDFAFYNYLGAVGLHTAYGKLYFGGYGGTLHCWDTLDGGLLWTYGNGGPGNSTSAGLTLAYGSYPIYPAVIADGVVYLDTGEHSANTPLYKDALIRAVNATTGEEIWTLRGWGGHHRREGFAVADGYLVYLNHYDMQIYSIGRGPSTTTISASPKTANSGSTVLIEGTVIDAAAGTKQDEQAARFPNGVPAVSDDNMRAWMEYIYMQKPRPADIVGVEVTLSAVDSEGNLFTIGTTTSDAAGLFSYVWTPETEGKYTVIATFLGSEAYWPSYAETALAVGPAPSPEIPIEPEAGPLITTEVAILIAIVVIAGVAIVAYWVMRRR